MSPDHDQALLCARVLDRLVEGDDLSGDPLLAEHLGSCVTCFRALTELRMRRGWRKHCARRRRSLPTCHTPTINSGTTWPREPRPPRKLSCREACARRRPLRRRR